MVAPRRIVAVFNGSSGQREWPVQRSRAHRHSWERLVDEWGITRTDNGSYHCANPPEGASSSVFVLECASCREHGCAKPGLKKPEQAGTNEHYRTRPGARPLNEDLTEVYAHDSVST